MEEGTSLPDSELDMSPEAEEDEPRAPSIRIGVADGTEAADE